MIFTYNRHKYLKRTINYWSNYKVKLLILDGSDVELDDPCLHAKNVRYVYDTRGLHERLKNSGKFIDTEFTILVVMTNFIYLQRYVLVLNTYWQSLNILVAVDVRLVLVLIIIQFMVLKYIQNLKIVF